MKSDPSIEPLPEALADVFREDGKEQRAPMGSRQRVLARLDASLGGGVAAPSSAPDRVDPPAPPTTPAPTASLLTKALPWITLAVGIGIGAAWSPRSKAPPSTDVPAPTPTITTTTPVPSARDTSTSPSATTAPAPEESAAPASNVPKKAVPSASSSDDAARHAQERALLDGARTALARRDGAGALVLLDRHRTRFPSGALTEEREALSVQGLAMDGRTNEARARAASFAKTYPNSLFLPAVEAAVKTP